MLWKWSVSILIETVQLKSNIRLSLSLLSELLLPRDTHLDKQSWRSPLFLCFFFFSAQPSALEFGFVCLGKAKAQTNGPDGQKACEWALWTAGRPPAQGSNSPPLRASWYSAHRPFAVSMRRSRDNLATANTNNKVMVRDRSRQALIVRVGLQTISAYVCFERLVHALIHLQSIILVFSSATTMVWQITCRCLQFAQKTAAHADNIRHLFKRLSMGDRVCVCLCCGHGVVLPWRNTWMSTGHLRASMYRRAHLSRLTAQLTQDI